MKKTAASHPALPIVHEHPWRCEPAAGFRSALEELGPVEPASVRKFRLHGRNPALISLA
jgi:hypothetical protein